MALFQEVLFELTKEAIKRLLPFLWRKADPLKWPIAVSFYILYYEAWKWLNKMHVVRLSFKRQEQIAMFYALVLIIDMAESGKLPSPRTELFTSSL
jgi:hypothetical protein